MKKRVFSTMDNGVYRIDVSTEDWSEGDLELMAQFGEPLVNLGGTISYSVADVAKEKTFGDEFVRLLHGFPYSRGFDSRDYGSVDEAVAIGKAWKEESLKKIDEAVVELRAKPVPLPSEEISEI